MRVVAICGSLGPNSANLDLLHALAAAAPSGADVTIAEPLDALPVFRPALAHDGTPPIVERWRQQLREADAVVVATPEYGHSLPGVLKNAIDWVIGSGELYAKPVAITAAVRDRRRGRLGLRALRDTLRAVDTRVLWEEPIIGGEGQAKAIDALWARLSAPPATRDLVLYDYPISGNGWKVRTVLRRLGLPFRIQWVDLLRGENQQAWFLDKTPVGQIPVLEFADGRCLRESSAILLTLAEGTDLLPTGDARAEVMAWLSFEQTFIDGIVSRAIFRRLHPKAIPTPEVFFEAWAREGTRGLQILDRHLEDREFMVGEQLSLADIALFAYTHRAHLANFDLAPLSSLRAWHARVAEAQGVRPIEDNPEATADNSAMSRL